MLPEFLFLFLFLTHPGPLLLMRIKIAGPLLLIIIKIASRLQGTDPVYRALTPCQARLTSSSCEHGYYSGFRKREVGSERLSNFTRDTQIESGKIEIPAKAWKIQTQVLNRSF